MKRLQTYAGPGITVTFDPNLCIHSAVCLRTLPAVFDVRRKRWIRPEAANLDVVVEAIDKCPSGALAYRLEDVTAVASPDEDVDSSATIVVSSNGPLLVEGRFKLENESGEPIDCAGRAALCRCGGSAKAPFCDGTHRKNGFQPGRRAGNGAGDS